MAKVSTLVDAFASYNSTTWAFSYGTPTVTSGQLVLNCVSSYEGIYSGVTYDLTSSSIYLEAVQVPTGGNGTRQAYMKLNVDSNNNVEFFINGGILYCRKKEAGVITTLHTVGTYNSTNHRWWKIQSDLISSTNYVSFWTSTNGKTWLQQGPAVTTSFAQTALYVEVGTGYTGTETSPPDLIIDNMNSAPTTVAIGEKDYNRTNAIFGVYGGYGSTGVTGVGTHESAVGRNVEIASDYVPHTAWTDLNYSTVRTYQLDGWRTWRNSRPGSKLVYGVPLLTDSNPGDFSGVVAGTYDTYFDAIATALVDSGHPDAIVRLGWEPNNPNIGPWQATDNPSGYASAFQHVVTRFRAASGQNFKFEMSSSLGFVDGHTLQSFASYYPGDTYVDYLGMNVYDLKYGDTAITPEARWTWIRQQIGGLDDFQVYANSKSKPIVCSEWGLYASGDAFAGGGDNPYFIYQMADYFNRVKPYYQCYFDSDWGGGVLNDFTNGKAAYVAYFSSPGVREAGTPSLGSSSSDTSSAAETSTLVVQRSSSDTGSGTDTHTLSKPNLPSADTGQGSEASAITVAISSSDTGTGTESQSISSPTPSSSDSGSGSETYSIATSLSRSDTGAGTESYTLEQVSDWSSPVAGATSGRAAALLLGPATIYIADYGVPEPADNAVGTTPSSAWSDLGGLIGGVTITFKQSYDSIELVQIPDRVMSRPKKSEVIAETSLAEPRIENFLYLLNEGSFASGSGYKSFTPSATVDEATPLTYRTVIIDGWNPDINNGRHKRRRIIMRKCLSVEGTVSKYLKDKQTTQDVSWSAHWVDSSTAPFKVIDEI